VKDSIVRQNINVYHIRVVEHDRIEADGDDAAFDGLKLDGYQLFRCVDTFEYVIGQNSKQRLETFQARQKRDDVRWESSESVVGRRTQGERLLRGLQGREGY
jgi:hypothetical protein